VREFRSRWGRGEEVQNAPVRRRGGMVTARRKGEKLGIKGWVD